MRETDENKKQTNKRKAKPNTLRCSLHSAAVMHIRDDLSRDLNVCCVWMEKMCNIRDLSRDINAFHSIRGISRLILWEYGCLHHSAEAFLHADGLFSLWRITMGAPVKTTSYTFQLRFWLKVTLLASFYKLAFLRNVIHSSRFYNLHGRHPHQRWVWCLFGVKWIHFFSQNEKNSLCFC